MQGDGATLRVHLARSWKNTGRKDPRLDLEIPAAGKFVWRVYTQLGRQYSMSGSPLPITNAEILAWCQLNRVRLSAWELEMIREFDSIALAQAQRAKP